jgi:hypothetical protein
VSLTERSRVVGGLIGLALLSGGLYHLVRFDDPYITFRYAQNWANGNGLVFNVGERVLGTTAPLYALLLGVGARAGIDIPTLARCLTVTSIAVVGILIYRLLDHEGHSTAGVIAGLVTITHPLIGDTQGFELNIFFAFVFGGAWAYKKNRPGFAGLLLATASLIRGDGLVPASLIGCHALVTDRHAFRMFTIAFLVPLTAVAAAAYAYYGHPLPGTLEAKRAMGRSGFWRTYLYGGARVAVLYTLMSPIMAIVPIVAVLGARQIGSVKSLLARGLVVWAVLIAGAYTAMGIPSAYNYYTQFIPCMAVLAGLGASSLKDRFNAIHPRAFVVAVSVVVVAQLWPAHRAITNPEPRYARYRAAAEELKAIVSDRERVAAVEIGIVGYFSSVDILDLVGLTEPRIRPHLAEKDVAWGVRELKPEYLLFHDPPWQSIETGVVQTPGFGRQYERIRTFEGEPPFRLALYRRK